MWFGDVEWWQWRWLSWRWWWRSKTFVCLCPPFPPPTPFPFEKRKKKEEKETEKKRRDANGLRADTDDPNKACEWCKYLSCIPTSANDRCTGTVRLIPLPLYRIVLVSEALWSDLGVKREGKRKESWWWLDWQFLGYHNDEHFDDKTVLGFAMRVIISPYIPNSPSYPQEKGKIFKTFVCSTTYDIHESKKKWWTLFYLHI